MRIDIHIIGKQIVSKIDGRTGTVDGYRLALSYQPGWHWQLKVRWSGDDRRRWVWPASIRYK